MISDDEMSEISYDYSEYSTAGDVSDVCEYDEEQGIRLMDSSINAIVSHAKEIIDYTPELSNRYVSEAACIGLLCQYRWDVTALITDMQEDRVFMRMVSPIPMKLVSNTCDSNAYLTCDVCTNDVPYEFTSSGGCGHSYCNSCWRKYITTCIEDDKVFAVKCMHTDCEFFLEGNSVIGIAQGYAELFTKKRFNNFVSRHSDIVYCPNESCSVLMKVTPDVVSVTCCKCHHEFCQMCHEAAHWPAPCRWSGQFNETCDNINIAALRQLLENNKMYGNLIGHFRIKQLLNQLRGTLMRLYMQEAGARIVLAVMVLCKFSCLGMENVCNYIRSLLRQTATNVSQEILEILDLTRNRWCASPAVISCLEETLRRYTEIPDILGCPWNTRTRTRIRDVDRIHANYEVLGIVKKCPGCSVMIEKVGGCNYMTCSSCRAQFCWRCLQSWNNHSYKTCYTTYDFLDGSCGGENSEGVVSGSSCNEGDSSMPGNLDSCDTSTENVVTLRCTSGHDCNVLRCEYEVLRRVLVLCPAILELKEFQDAKNKQEILTETEPLFSQLRAIEDKEKYLAHTSGNIRQNPMVHEVAVKAINIIFKGYRLSRYSCIHLLNMGDLKRAQCTDLYMQFVHRIMESCESTLNILESLEFGLKAEEGRLIDVFNAAEIVQTQFVDTILRTGILF